MKALAFNYLKNPDQVSERALLVLKTYCDYYEGIDISELSAEDAVAVANAAKAIYDSYRLHIAQLVEAFDLKYNYRRFIPSKMENISEF